MKDCFLEIIKKLNKVKVPFKGGKLFLLDKEKHQIVFMKFDKDTIIPAHQHSFQVEFVISGKAEVIIDGKKNTYEKGSSFLVPEMKSHSVKIYAGYRSIAFFEEPSRYISE